MQTTVELARWQFCSLMDTKLLIRSSGLKCLNHFADLDLVKHLNPGLRWSGTVCSVLTNGDRSSTFALQRSVQQGCPLPSSTVCYCIGATCPENKTTFKDSGLGGVENLTGMYADDVLMYLKKTRSLNVLVQLLHDLPDLTFFDDLNFEWVFAVVVLTQMLLSCQRCFLWNSIDDDDFNI